METITDTTQRFTEDDLARLLVELEKHVNLYQFLADKLFTALDADSDIAHKQHDVAHAYKHCEPEAKTIMERSDLIEAVSMQVRADEPDWCSGSEVDAAWSEPHQRYQRLMDRVFSIEQLVREKMLQFIVNHNELKTMEDFANGKEV